MKKIKLANGLRTGLANVAFGIFIGIILEHDGFGKFVLIPSFIAVVFFTYFCEDT